MADQPQTCCLTRGLAPVIWLFCIIRNNADVLPFTLRHYSRFCDRMFFWDDKSTDGTTEILKAHPKVTYQEWPYVTGLDDDLFIDFNHATYPLAIGHADWCMWIDADEILYHHNLVDLLACAKEGGFNVISTQGYNMTHEGMPKDDGRQIWEICPTGTKDDEYSKPQIFTPESRARFEPGRHKLEIDAKPWYGRVPIRVLENSGVKLLHYRNLGFEYSKARCAKNLKQASYVAGKGRNFSAGQRPDFTGSHSPQWAAEQMKKATVII